MSEVPPKITALRSDLAVKTRLKGPDDPATVDARRNLAAAVAEKRLQEIVAAAPPFTADQRSRLSALING